MSFINSGVIFTILIIISILAFVYFKFFATEEDEDMIRITAAVAIAFVVSFLVYKIFG